VLAKLAGPTSIAYEFNIHHSNHPFLKCLPFCLSLHPSIIIYISFISKVSFPISDFLSYYLSPITFYYFFSYYFHVLGIDIKLHTAVLPLLSPLCRSLSLQVQLGPIEVLIELSMTRWWFVINT